MDTMKILLLVAWITLNSTGVPTTHIEHHVDIPAEIHVTKHYGGKIF